MGYLARSGDDIGEKFPRAIGLLPSCNAEECECGLSEQTPEHILQTCPNMSSRQNFWLEPTALKTKLWGTPDDLRKAIPDLTWGKLCRVSRIEGLIGHDRRRRKPIFRYKKKHFTNLVRKLLVDKPAFEQPPPAPGNHSQTVPLSSDWT
jgi:hypothetical protein